MNDDALFLFLESLIDKCRSDMEEAGIEKPAVVLGFRIEHGQTFKQAVEQVAAERGFYAQ